MTRWIKKNGGIVLEYSGKPRTAETMSGMGYLPWTGTLPVSRLDIVDGAIVELPEPEVPPRKFSRRSIYLELNGLGLWDGVEGYMENNGFLKEFNYSLDISEDHPVFAGVCEQLGPILAERGADLDELLNHCVMEV